MYTNHVSSFQSRKEAMLFEGSGWENNTTIYLQDLEAVQSNLIKICKDKLVRKLQYENQKMLELRIKTSMHDQVRGLPENLKESLCKEYTDVINDYNKT